MGYVFKLRVNKKTVKIKDKKYEYFYLELPKNFNRVFGIKPKVAKMVIGGIDVELPVVCFNKARRERRRVGDIIIEASKKTEEEICRIPIQNDIYYTLGEPEFIRVEVVGE